MSAKLTLALTAACLALGMVSLLMAVKRRLASRRQRPAPEQPLPWLFRLAVLPAEIVAPLVSLAVPAACVERQSRELESLGLAPALPARLWLSIRVVHALFSATLTLMLPGHQPLWLIGAAALAAYSLGAIWLKRLREQRIQMIGKELPMYLDLMTVCVEAGATLTSGIRLIVAQSPDSPLRAYFDQVLREVRSGRPRAQAFAFVAEAYAVDSLTTLAAALSAAEGAGLSLGQVLRAQGTQRTAERFARAERLAMQAPVKMLGPLILCIFPCTFIVLAVPIAVRLREALIA